MLACSEFYCPNGHKQTYSCIDQMQRLSDRLDSARRELEDAYAAHRTKDRSNASLRGVIKRLKNKTVPR